MASIEKRETSRGIRYDVRYREPGGRTRVKTWRRKADAERFARAVEVDKDRGLFVDPAQARRPLDEVAAQWLNSNPGKRDASWQRDESAIRVHIGPALGSRPVGSVTPAHVQSAVNTWAKVRAARTVHREYRVLRAIFNYAVTNDIIGRNPCRGIKLPEVEPLRPHIVTADELHRLVDGLGGVGAFGPMAFLGTIDGLRWGEVAALRVGRLDFEASTVTVAETVVRGKGGANGFGQPKSAAGRRVLAVPVDLMVMLVEHMGKRGLSKSDTDALLFAAPEGGPLRYSNWLRRIWYPATIAAGLGEMVEDEDTGRPRYKGLGFHDLRRANATGLVAEGVDIKTAQAMLGHSNPQLTLDLYAQSVASLGERAAEAMAARYFKRSPRENRAMEADSDPDDQGGDVAADGSDLGG